MGGVTIRDAAGDIIRKKVSVGEEIQKIKLALTQKDKRNKVKKLA